jgi:hypothetical protein
VGDAHLHIGGELFVGDRAANSATEAAASSGSNPTRTD